MFFFKNHTQNEAGRIVPDLFLFFKKALYEVKAQSLQLSFNVSIASNLKYNKSKLYKILAYWSRDFLNFGFLKKDLGMVSPPHFVYDFSRKMVFMLCSIK